ncbi:MAG: formylglycine-generating enzyme family protein [Bacteroides sp.]|nr:formylglycine-generating enzyme family protein [Bacteroides sp.]
MKKIMLIMACWLLPAALGIKLHAVEPAKGADGIRATDDAVLMSWQVKPGETKTFSFRGAVGATYRIAWGDGDTVTVMGRGEDSTLRMSHRYLKGNTYTVSLYGERDYNYSYNYTETALGMEMKMVYVGSGTFLMGCTLDNVSACNVNERPAHRVSLSSFGIGMYEVTQSQWEKVMGSTIQQQRDKYASSASLQGNGADYPMYYVSWEDAQAFCEKLSVASGKRYALPTEAQWEYAARGARKSVNKTYSGSNTVDGVAWYTSNGGSSAHTVGGKTPNELGIHDMSGNVWEWCADWYGTYDETMNDDPTDPATGTQRVARGGSRSSSANDCRVSFRTSFKATEASNLIGFRVVCLP